MSMVITQPVDLADSARRLRVATLTNTRWLTVTGQIVTIVIVTGFFGFELPILPCLLLVAAAAVLNLYLTWQYPANQRFSPDATLMVLTFDIIQLSGLLFFTGGIENPFAILMAVPVIIAAATLPMRHIATIGAVAVAMATALVFVHMPLPWYPGSQMQIPPVYVGGLWLAVVCTVAFSAFYIQRVVREARHLQEALAATEFVLQREQHLSALDGLAAAAAHELGTPLGTIAVVAKEMDRSVEGPEALKEDIALLRTQADRCREILARLSTLQTTTETHISRLPVMSMLDEVAEPHRDLGVPIKVERRDCAGAEPVLRRNPGMLYGLGNLVENAVDFAETMVAVDVSWNSETMTIVVRDDGPGFSLEELEHLGEPAMQKQQRARPQRRSGEGLGLGIFIAKTLLERTGANVHFGNASRGSGAVATIVWPRSSIDAEFA